MKETTKFDDFSGDKAISLAKTFAKDAYTKELGVVLSVAFSDIRNLPALGFNQDEPIPLKEYVKKWVSLILFRIQWQAVETAWQKIPDKTRSRRKINSPNPKRRYRRQFRRYS
ncbi:MAG: hypothetical protein ACLUQ6_12060 [Alistipes onderdonkii]